MYLKLIKLKKTITIDINKYFQKFKDVLIIVPIRMKNISKIFIIDDQHVATFFRLLKIFVDVY